MTKLAGLRINLDGTLDPVLLPERTQERVPALQAAIGCNLFDLVRVEPKLDLFIDDEGLYRAELNPMLSVMLHVLGEPRLLSGAGVFLGGDPDTGEAPSLSQMQAKRLILLHTALADMGQRIGIIIHRLGG